MAMIRALRVAFVTSVLCMGVFVPGAATRPTAASAASDLDAAGADAEARLVDRLNADRASAGLVALQVDPRLTSIARSRSADMATFRYFGHQQPDGRTVFEVIEASGIDWFGAAETIAWNPLPSLVDSALAAEAQWMGSPPHRDILLGRLSNYIGVGSATDVTGRTLWTAVLIEGSDGTPPSARLSSVVRIGTTAGGAIVRATWAGADVVLASHTAGVRDFQVQRRVDGGSWVTIRSATTALSLSATMPRGHRWEFRIRARDRAGWYSRWTLPRAIRS